MLLIFALFFMADSVAGLNDTKRTENEWICPSCRKPAEGSYCSRCGQPYIK